MSNMNSEHIAGFIEHVLYSHRCFAEMMYSIDQNKIAAPIEIANVGIVLKDLNIIAKLRLDSFVKSLTDHLGISSGSIVMNINQDSGFVVSVETLDEVNRLLPTNAGNNK